MTLKDEMINAPKDIIDMLETLEGYLKPKALEVVGDDVRFLLLGLAGALKQYEKEKAGWQVSGPAKTILKSLEKQFNTLEIKFENYKQCWAAPTVIESSPDKFIEETKELFTIIYKYLNQEKTELLPSL